MQNPLSHIHINYWPLLRVFLPSAFEMMLKMLFLIMINPLFLVLSFQKKEEMQSIPLMCLDQL